MVVGVDDVVVLEVDVVFEVVELEVVGVDGAVVLEVDVVLEVAKLEVVGVEYLRSMLCLKWSNWNSVLYWQRSK